MALEEGTRRTRRVVLAGAVATGAAVALDLAMTPVSAQATVQYVVLGGSNTAASETSVTNTDGFGNGISGVGTGTGNGVGGNSASGAGVFGTSNSGYGVYGNNNTSGYGVYGISASGKGVGAVSASGDGVNASSGGSGKSGVYGHQSNAGGWAVNGNNDAAQTNGYFGGANGMLGQARGSTGSGVVGFAGTGNPPVGPAHVGVYGAASAGRGGRVQRQCGPAQTAAVIGGDASQQRPDGRLIRRRVGPAVVLQGRHNMEADCLMKPALGCAT